MSGKLKTLLFVAGIGRACNAACPQWLRHRRCRRVALRAGCFVFLATVSASAEENTTWTKFDNSAPGLADSGVLNSRIPLGTTGKGDDYHAKPGSVIKDGSTYKMWYSGYDGSNFRIYYATSPDGLNWAKYDNNIPGASDDICTNGTIALGTAGQGDSAGASRPSVIKDDSTYKMWYMGNIGGTNRIYYATSTDGLTWTKKNNDIPDDSDTTSTDGRIPLGTSGKGDVNHSGYPTVVKDGSTYKMWYGARGPSNWRIYHASSTDGLTWTKVDNSIPPDSNTTGTNGCVPLGETGGDTDVVYYPCVILDDSCYRMWYSGKDASYYRIYNATSTDGLTWTKVTNAVPGDTNTTSTLGRIPRGTSGRGDDGVIHNPTVIKDGDTYKMWYAGSDGAKYRIYFATSTDSLTWTKKDNTTPDASDLPGNGRIPMGTSGKGDGNFAIYSAVIKDGDTYKMWYGGKDATTFRIYYATSPDSMIWVKYNNTVPGNTNTTSTDGRIPLGTTGTGDDCHVAEPAVIKDDSTYKMWYAGSDGANWRIYYATSSNGLTWIKYTNAVPPDTSDTTNWGKGRIPLGTSGGDSKHANGPSVIKDGSTYKMWYTGSDGTNYCIYHATSSNGLTWTKFDNSVPPDTSDTTNWGKGRIPLGTSGTGDEKFARMPTVIKVRSVYKMWYSGRDVDGSKDRIYYATSTDGLTWTKYTNAIPANSDTTSTSGRIPLGASGGDTVQVYTPCVIKEGTIQEGYKYKMWYSGKDASTYRIYLATCEQPPVPCTIFSSW